MIFRINKTKDYTVMSNVHLRDKRLSLKAKGLLSQMLSLPDDWDFSLDWLISANRESKSAIMSALDELKEFKYLSISRKTTDNGRFDYLYEIFESPYTDFPNTEKPCTEKPCTENRTQLNTNIPNTNKYFDSPKLNEAFLMWLQYKKERRQSYQQTGLEMLIGKIQKAVREYGETAVIESIENCISNGYAGLYFNGAKTKPGIDESKTDLDDIF